MHGETDLNKLLKEMSPCLEQDEYVFISVQGSYSDCQHLNPICSFAENEGLTLIITKKSAEENNYPVADTYRKITLQIHSSLDAVGLTAAASSKLAENGISANIVAAYYHDHIFVKSEDAQKALDLLKELSLK